MTVFGNIKGMSSVIETILRQLNSDYVTSAELSIVMPGPEDARYAQIKRALAKGYLVRLKRGLYRRVGYLEKTKPHPFEMAHYLYWPSYVSLESSLSYHGLIPEVVYSTTCVTSKRSREFKNSFGVFSYKTVPHKDFFTGVDRVKERGGAYYIAKPWKALCDYVYCYKKDWHSLSPLTHSLRIDKYDLPILSEDERLMFTQYYCSKRIERFLKGVSREY